MCYMTLLSTTSNQDLSLVNDDLVRFSRNLPSVPEAVYLQHAFKWFIDSSSIGCSCALRHLYVSSVELGFGIPESWYPEEPEDIEATKQVCATIRGLLAQGERVDCVDAWTSGDDVAAPLAGEIVVDLSSVQDAQFRFFEMHRFEFVDSANEDRRRRIQPPT